MSYAAPAPYAAHLRVGGHTWDTASTDYPDYGPLAGLRFSWAARQDDGWPTQHDPTALVFGVIVEAGTDFDDVDQGTEVHFTFTPDGYTTPLVSFGGTVRDLVGRPHPLGMVYEITAVDHLQALQETYRTQAYIPPESPTADLWTIPLQDAAGAGGGTGTRPYLPDPFIGDAKPYDFGGGGTTGLDAVVFGDTPAGEPTWNVLTGILARAPQKPGGDPLDQRGILTYRLDSTGALDAIQPFEGTWSPRQGADRTTTLDGGLLLTGATEWSRQRIEPNRAEFTGFLAGIFYERPHTGVTITRYLNSDAHPYLGGVTDPAWIVAGTEAPDQWSTALTVLASRAPELVADWFTLPTAMATFVECVNIDPRHTPTGSGELAGLLAGAALVIPPGGDWFVTFALRKTLPDPPP